MKKLILLFLIPFIQLSSQKIEAPSHSLTGIKTSLSISEIPDSVSLKFTLEGKGIEKVYSFPVSEGKIDTFFTAATSGKYTISISNGIKRNIRIMPGWLSIVPPLLAIFLALLLRQVLVSLAAGVYIGAIFIYDYNPFIALLRFADTIMIDSIADKEHVMIIAFTLMIGGVVGVISKNGGTAGLANLITKFAKTQRSGLISSWFLGLFIFFDDYANTLIIGNTMRPITDKLKISREKLAYIVDSTAAPIASLVIISTWIGYELGLIAEGLAAINYSESAYSVFINTLPFRFYPIAAIFFVFITSYLRRDMGPMYNAEKRATEEGKLINPNSEVQEFSDKDYLADEGIKIRWYNGAVPILIILLGTIGGLFYTGINNLNQSGIVDYSIQDIVSNSDSFAALLWSSFIASIAAVFMSIVQKILKLNDALHAWQNGVKTMMVAVIILVFAWAISDITTELKTADYLISILSDTIDPRFLPVLVFLISAFISFSTGTSWGTMAIVMPIVIPLSYKMAMMGNLDPEHISLIIYGVVSSVLAGSVFGDHCSPIADTTILSSMASGCNHIDHVNTQLPYAVLVGIVTMIFGDLITAFGFSPYLSILIIFGVLFLMVRFLGKKV